MVSFSWCILFISVTRLSPLSYGIARFNVDGQFNIFRADVNFWTQSEPYARRAEVRASVTPPFLEQSEINSMYKKKKKKWVTAQCSSVRGSRETDSASLKHKTSPGWNLWRGQRFDVPEVWFACFIWFVLKIRDSFKNSFWWLSLACRTVLKHWLTCKLSFLSSERLNKSFGILWLASKATSLRKESGQSRWMRCF